MTLAAVPRARAVRRTVFRTVAVAMCVLVLMTAGIMAIYVSRPQSGLGRDLLEAIEYPLEQNETLHYNAHRVLGKMFSLCPCTAGLSADQYRRAAFHRPRDEKPAP